MRSCSSSSSISANCKRGRQCSRATTHSWWKRFVLFGLGPHFNEQTHRRCLRRVDRNVASAERASTGASVTDKEAGACLHWSRSRTGLRGHLLVGMTYLHIRRLGRDVHSKVCKLTHRRLVGMTLLHIRRLGPDIHSKACMLTHLRWCLERLL